MNRPLLALQAILLLLGSASPAFALAGVKLDGAWTLRQRSNQETTPATVPGCVHTDLRAAGKIPDPFYRDNEARLQWISAETWEYSRTFDVPTEVLGLENLRLRCEGLDTVATVTLNGRELGHTANMFRTWEFDVRGLLQPTGNTLQITFTPASDYMKAHALDPAFPGFEVTKTGAIRKEACNFGWDWGPKLTTAGIWKPISIVGWNGARLSGALIQQDLHDPAHAYLDIDIAAETDGKTALRTETTVTLDGVKVAGASQPLRQADGVGRTTLKIDDPQRWWPAGMGKQPLYEVRIVLRDEAGTTLDETVKRVGLRTVEWLAKTDTRPLGFSVNGKPFFAKGANWIPPTVFPTQVTPELLTKYMRDAVAANMNTIRLWGGGYYEEDKLFDLCDELGILLWLDFKFASSAYPSYDPAFVANVGGEVEDNVKRIRHHPSIGVWCGNNEVRLSYFVDQRGGKGKVSFADYDNFFAGFIGGAVRNLAPQGVYTPGSPEAGDEHFWGVWHGNQPFAAYGELHGMMTEFGFQSFPEPRTVRSFTAPEDRASVDTPVMVAHQKSVARSNHKITRMIETYFRPGKDFDSMLWLSQITQAYGIVGAAENWRREWPRSTGCIVWQYNDAWPGATWSMVDCYGHKKALLYQLAHAYAPLMVSAQTGADGGAEVFVCSDRLAACRPTLRWTLTDAAGAEVDGGTQEADVPLGTSSTRVATLPCKEALARHSSSDLLLWLTLVENGEMVAENVHLFARPKALALIDPAIHADVVPDGDGYAVTLAAEHPALYAWVELADVDADYSDNFVGLRAGQPRRITVQPARPMGLEEFRQQLRVRSLFDTFAPGAVDLPVAPAADGSLTAPADRAEITSTTAGLDDKVPGAVGGWESLDTVVKWKVRIDRPGRYSVAAETSCDRGEGGGTYTVRVGDQALHGTLQPDKDWDHYTTTTLGTVDVAAPGTVDVTVQADTKPRKYVMNLRAVTLRPVP